MADRGRVLNTDHKAHLRHPRRDVTVCGRDLAGLKIWTGAEAAGNFEEARLVAFGAMCPVCRSALRQMRENAP